MNADRLSVRLKITAAIPVGFGLLCTLSLIPSLAWPLASLLDLLTWPLNGPTLFADPEGRLATAILGGVMVGWGTLIWSLSEGPARAAPAATRRLVVTSLLVWFVIDGIGSLLAGAPLNLPSNAVFLATMLLPLWDRPPGTADDAPMSSERTA